jgi:hypothetical protein
MSTNNNNNTTTKTGVMTTTAAADTTKQTNQSITKHISTITPYFYSLSLLCLIIIIILIIIYVKYPSELRPFWTSLIGFFSTQMITFAFRPSYELKFIQFVLFHDKNSLQQLQYQDHLNNIRAGIFAFICCIILISCAVTDGGKGYASISLATLTSAITFFINTKLRELSYKKFMFWFLEEEQKQQQQHVQSGTTNFSGTSINNNIITDINENIQGV